MTATVHHQIKDPYANVSSRIVELAKPKEVKTIWITTVGPRVMWGTQEGLWPIPREALSAAPRPRLAELARPKKLFQKGLKSNRPEFTYSCGRSSVIWGVKPAATQTAPTSRLETLAMPKQTRPEYQQREDRHSFQFSCGRSSPIWGVSRGARSCPDKSRLQDLASHKTFHPEYCGNREVQTIIPSRALTARPTRRLVSLAEPKDRPEGPFREPMWPVSEAVRNVSTAPRTNELALPKGTPDGWQPPKNEIWEVTSSARKAVPNSRLEELSQPIVRASMDHVQFDPDAFFVKAPALKAKCSRRVEELAVPIQR